MTLFAMTNQPSILLNPTRFVFFTGKGGVGKTSLAASTALTLADRGKAVLLVSTDPASNLDEILDVKLSNNPVPVPNAPGLDMLNIDPGEAADAYRARVLDQLSPTATSSEVEGVKEQLSGACTTEIAAFDEFVDRLTNQQSKYDHIVFDTAPTGHTLRLLSLPKAWSGFLGANDRGASCLGPHSGLKMQERRFHEAMANLGDPAITTVILVARAEKSALTEAARTSIELSEIGISNQRLIINGEFHATDRTDSVALSIERIGNEALLGMPEHLNLLPCDHIPLRRKNMIGLSALRGLLNLEVLAPEESSYHPDDDIDLKLPNLSTLIDQLSKDPQRLILVMGKGGVGKTTIAAAIAVGLVERGHQVHLTTTDPAAHLAGTIAGYLTGLTVDRIDPKIETERYIEKMLKRNSSLDAEALALLKEDLASPCTEEVAVFHAFSHVISEARGNFVILDTAPTGHSLLLMDATGAYHRQISNSVSIGTSQSQRLITPLMRLQDPEYTRVLLVTLAETTPVSQAHALQLDLQRAEVTAYAWIINKSLLAAGTHDPLLQARMKGERQEVDRVLKICSTPVYFLPWQARPPVGLEALSEISH